MDDIGFEIAAGSTTALLGGNGAGKTTTISMLLGLLLPTSGAISVFGHDMLRDRYAVLPRMNFSSPYVDLPRRLTVRQNLLVYADLYGLADARTRLRQLAEELYLAELMDRPLRPAFRRPKDARGHRQGAIERTGTAAARRAHGVA